MLSMTCSHDLFRHNEYPVHLSTVKIQVWCQPPKVPTATHHLYAFLKKHLCAFIQVRESLGRILWLGLIR